MPATEEQPPPYSASPQVNTQDLQRRQEELERKAAELQRKEEQMRDMQYGGESVVCWMEMCWLFAHEQAIVSRAGISSVVHIQWAWGLGTEEGKRSSFLSPVQEQIVDTLLKCGCRPMWLAKPCGCQPYMIDSHNTNWIHDLSVCGDMAWFYIVCLVLVRRNNFPPLPEKCCVQPCFYQDFAVDIPLEFQRIVKIVYYLWIGKKITVVGTPGEEQSAQNFSVTSTGKALFSEHFYKVVCHQAVSLTRKSFAFCATLTAYTGLLFLNLIGSLAYLIGTIQDDLSNKSGVTFGLSILWLVLFTPCSFVCWYRPLYKAFRWVAPPQGSGRN